MSHPTHVRRHRKRWALTQDELAEMIGRTQAQLSRYEAGEATPDFETALSFQVIFGHSPRALFAALYGAVEETVMTRAARLERRLEGKRDRLSETKRILLTGMAHRARRASPKP
jgi:transcriptional regulator with XRE-family HTH domain